MSAPRLCACGCGQPLPPGMRADARFIDGSHRMTATRLRRDPQGATVTAERFWQRYAKLRKRTHPQRARHAGCPPRCRHQAGVSA